MSIDEEKTHIMNRLARSNPEIHNQGRANILQWMTKTYQDYQN